MQVNTVLLHKVSTVTGILFAYICKRCGTISNHKVHGLS